jgi:anion-transporting  ArsA/GET3 family ATPase
MEYVFMNELTEKIQIQYLQEEIEKMLKTAKGLKKMIDEKDPKKNRELIDSLQKIRKITLNSIEHKQRELKQLYNKNIDEENN